MLTGRGWSLLIVALLFLLLGILMVSRQAFLLGVLGLSVLIWFLSEWAIFLVRVRLALPKVVVRRAIRIEGRDVPMLWAGRSFMVTLDIDAHPKLRIPYFTIEDLVPTEAEHLAGRNRHALRLEPGDQLTFEYQLQCDAPGLVRFEGQRVQVADAQGFFYFRTFLRSPIEIPVLPPLTDSEGLQRTDKRLNILPPPGVHRLRGPGSGSELLDLRDYRPGDPPKMIAWKPTARKDKLIVKEFETEVPVRCTLFLDTSQSVRLGPPGRNALTGIVSVAAAVAQAAASNRDLVGVTIFDESSTQVVRPARGPRHLIGVMQRLAHAASLPTSAPKADLLPLQRLGLSLSYEVYPDLLSGAVNSLPWRMFWRPLLDSNRGWRVLLLLFMPMLVYFAWYRETLMSIALWSTPQGQGRGLVFLFLLVLPTLLGLGFWFFYGIRGYFDTNPAARRKKLAAVVSQVMQLPHGETARMQVDDEAMAAHLQAFLAKHHVPYPVPLYDAAGRYQFRGGEKIKVLAAALANAVGRGRDNELFILFADLIELDDELEPLIGAVRVALGRHHQVLLVCPWLPQMPTPEEFTAPDPLDLPPPTDEDELEDFLRNQEIARYHRAYHHVRHTFGRLGVTVLRVNQGDAVRVVLDRIERLRLVGRRRR